MTLQATCGRFTQHQSQCTVPARAFSTLPMLLSTSARSTNNQFCRHLLLVLWVVNRGRCASALLGDDLRFDNPGKNSCSTSADFLTVFIQNGQRRIHERCPSELIKSNHCNIIWNAHPPVPQELEGPKQQGVVTCNEDLG